MPTAATVVTFQVVASEDLTIPAVVVQKRTRFTEVSGREVSLGDAVCNVSCQGDVNVDGTATIADVTSLINYLLTGNDSAVGVGFSDLNEDNKVSIADVTALISLLLKG